MEVAHNYQLLSDKELADLYRTSAQQDLLATLFNRYKDLIFGVCLKYLKDLDAATDACSDIYIEMVEKMLKHEVQNPKAWLYQVAKNHCLLRLRKNKKMPVDSLPDDFVQLDVNWHPDLAMEKEKKLTSLEKCLETLKAEQKSSVSLFYLEEKSYQEIAAITGIGWNTVRSHIQNGRRNLKNCMEQHEQSPR